MQCNFRSLRMDAAIVHGRACQLRRPPDLLFESGRRLGRHSEASACALLRERFRVERLPDLEQQVRRHAGRRAAHACAVLARCGDALEAVADARLVVIDRCQLDARGRCFVGVSLATTAHPARAGDELLSGAYFDGDLAADRVTIGARFVRPARWSAFALPGRTVEPGEDVSRILRGSARRRVREVASALAAGRWIPVEHPVAGLATLAVHVPGPMRDPLRARFHAGRERTLHGAVCVLADLARDARDCSRAVRLERLAGDALLACAPLARGGAPLAAGAFVRAPAAYPRSGGASGSGSGA